MNRHHVCSSPSEIPYGGFSPVRLQIDIPPRSSSSPLTRRRFIRGPQFISLAATGIPLRGKCRPKAALGAARRTNAVDPEALGSPAGYVVPPGRRLLWPHPSLWFPPTSPGKSRFTPGRVNEAAQFALCCGPEGCLPFIDKGFYFRAFIP